MARPCTYTFTDQQGNEQTLGLSAFKAYLAQGGLEHLFPEKQFPWTPQFSRTGFEVSPPQRSALWQRWFGKSRMVHNGEPIRFYHGTNADFTVFDKGRLGGATQHSTAKLGHFFTRNQDEAYQYGDKVHEVFLSVQNPYVITTDQLDQRMGDDPGKYADKLQQQGYDGIYLKDIGQAIVFNSNQAKLTSNVSPTFGEDIRYSREATTALETLSTEDARQHLVDHFGVGIDNLIKQGILNFTDGKAAWPEIAQKAARGDEEAVYINGKVYIDLRATDKSRLNSVLLHELGEHYGLRRMIGDQAYRSLQQQITNRAKIAGSRAEKIWNGVKANYGHLQEGSDPFVAEVIAKLGEYDPKAPWYRRLLTQVKAFLMRMGLARGLTAGTVTEDDLHELLKTSLQTAARGFVKDEARLYGESLAYSVPAWHGTPHEVDKFSTAKIGTGEGAQAFGYGLYFTDRKDIAEYYRNKLSGFNPNSVEVDGKVYSYIGDGKIELIKALKEKDFPTTDVVLFVDALQRYKGLENVAANYGWVPENASESDMEESDRIMRIVDKVGLVKSTGKLYHVELAPEQDEYLDWDKPLSEQSDRVKEVLLHDPILEKEASKINAKREELNALSPGRLTHPVVGKIATKVFTTPNFKAAEAYRRLTLNLGSDKAASDYLHSLGIRGTRYKAEGGKSDANNYVIFKDEDVNIVARFSRPNMTELKQKILRDEYGDPTLTGQAIRKLDEKWSAVAKNRFAALSVRQMVEYAAHMMPGLKKYQDLLQKREAEVSSWWRVGDRLVADVWKKLPKQEAKKLAKVMHSSTLDDVDVSKDWTGVFAFNGDDSKDISPGYFAYTHELLTPGRKAALGLEAMKRGAEQLSGNRNAEADRSNPVMYFDKRGYLFGDEHDAKAFVALIRKRVEEQRKERSSNNYPDENIKREIKHRELKPEYDSLTDPSKTVYSEANDMHNTLFDARLSELENRISDAVLNAEKRKALLAQLRAKFESGSLNWYYAPLSRFGNFWMYGTDKDGERWFKTFKTASARDEYVSDFTGPRGGKLIGSGSTLSNLEALEGKATSDSFIADVQRKIDAAGMDADTTERLKDQIYQMYLATLPDISVRHNSMRRSGVLGFEEDAMQSFAHAIHHGATQLANMKYGRDMREVLTDHKKAKELAENHSQKEKYHLENEAAEILKDRWDELSEKGALEERQLYPDDFDEEWTPKLLAAAIALRNRLGGGVTLEGEAPIKKMSQKDATEALDHIISRNEDILHAAELILAKDVDKATDVLDELTLAYDHMVNYNSGTLDQVASAINQANFIGMLGFSLSSGIVNLVQTPGVAMPVVAGKYGIEKTRKAFGQSYREFMTAVFKRKLDIDGNVSITAILDEKLAAAIKAGDDKAVKRIQDELEAMERFKDEGDISRTRSFDLLGIGQEGYAYGGRFHDFTQKAGWMFHHGERLNREVTLLSSYRLAIAEGKDSQHAIEYARFVNNRSHLDYSSENAARIFRGPLAKIALQFKKYQQGMLFLWARTAVDAWKDVKSENFADTPHGRMLFEQAKLQKKESVRTFYALMFMQASLAGSLGFPMMGMVGALYKGIANALGDDDDPRELEKDLRLGLAGLIGETGAEVVTKGFFNTFTPINLASRLDQADIFFHEPMKELEGRDAAQHYVAQLFGPTGGTAEKVAQGLSYAIDGYWGRAAESILPKAVSDLAKAARFSVEGAKTLDNMPLKDMSAMESLLQAWGFGSSALERKYAERGYAKEHEAAIKETRTKIMREAAWAKINGERADMAAIREWNRKHPEKPINPDHIAASVKGIKQSVEKRKERGYVVDPKLEYLYEESELMD